MSRSDPIRDRYYRAIEIADAASEWLFYIGAVLSLVSFFVDKIKFPIFYAIILIAFCLATVSLFAVGIISRLYLTPRAQDKRLQDFFSSACGVNLIHQRTDGYYNNDFIDPIKRMAAQVMESSYFSKAIALKMAKYERIRVIVYGAIWFICLLCRRVDLGIVVAASQAVFSEQVLAKWMRLEWLRGRFESTFEDVYRLFQSQPPVEQFNAMAFEAVSKYETAKANAAITLSSKVFNEMNPVLSQEWDTVKAALDVRFDLPVVTSTAQ